MERDPHEAQFLCSGSADLRDARVGHKCFFLGTTSESFGMIIDSEVCGDALANEMDLLSTK